MSNPLEWETLRRIDAICIRFEDAWRGGGTPDIDSYLDGTAGAEGEKLLSELQKVDRFYREQQARLLERTEETITFPAGAAEVGDARWPRIPGYTLVRELGRGAMGVVYKAWNERLKRTEAIKVVRGGPLAGPEERARFAIEVEAAAALDHRHIVPVYGSGDVDGVLYLAMRHAENGSLADRTSAFTPRAAASLIAKVAAGIDFAHRRGVLHRDLKPGNVLLDAAGEPMVADFGLAKRVDMQDPVTISGVIQGTLGYMAPEQAKAEKTLTVAVDVFGLGAVLYALLTGRPPFAGETLNELLTKTEECSPPAPSKLSANVDPDIAAICMKCLEKDPARRYATAAHLVEDLERYLRGQQISARLPGLWGRAVRVLLRQQFRNVREWGWITLLGGILGAACHFLAAWAIATQQPRRVYVLPGLGHALAYVLICYCALRGRRFDSADRQTLAVALSLWMTSILLPIVYAPTDNLTQYRLSLYPLLALLHGLAYFIMGSLFWGGFFLYGIGFFVLGVVMRLAPASAAIVFGAYFGVTQIPLGWYLIRLKV